MKRRQLVMIVQQIRNLRDVKNTKLSYNLLKNLNLIGPVMQPVEVVQAKIEQLNNKELQEYDTRRVDLCHEHAKLDDDGKPIIIKKDGVERFDMEDKEAFNEAIEKLREEYSEVFLKKEELQSQLIELLNEDVEIKLHKVSADCLPKDLNLEELERIKDLLEL